MVIMFSSLSFLPLPLSTSLFSSHLPTRSLIMCCYIFVWQEQRKKTWKIFLSLDGFKSSLHLKIYSCKFTSRRQVCQIIIINMNPSFRHTDVLSVLTGVTMPNTPLVHISVIAVHRVQNYQLHCDSVCCFTVL